MSRSTKVSVDGADLHVDVDGDGHAVLFLHGMGCDATDWQPQMDAFRGRFRCIAVDHRGHGRSTRDVGAGLSLPGLADDAAAVLDALGVHTAHVVGLSMGGMVAQQLALAHPDRVCTLSLLDTFSDPGPMGDGLGAMADSVEAAGIDALAGAFEQLVFAAKTRSDRPELLARFDRQFRANDAAALASDLRAIAGIDTHARLGSIRVPTLVVVGEEDQLTPPDRGEILAKEISEARFEVIPDAGHFTNLEEPDAVNALLARQFAHDCQH